MLPTKDCSLVQVFVEVFSKPLIKAGLSRGPVAKLGIVTPEVPSSPQVRVQHFSLIISSRLYLFPIFINDQFLAR